MYFGVTASARRRFARTALHSHDRAHRLHAAANPDSAARRRRRQGVLGTTRRPSDLARANSQSGARAQRRTVRARARRTFTISARAPDRREDAERATRRRRVGRRSTRRRVTRGLGCRLRRPAPVAIGAIALSIAGLFF